MSNARSFVLAFSVLCAGACTNDYEYDFTSPPDGGASGSSGEGGSAGEAGASGTAGQAGTSGSAGQSGAAGSGGCAGGQTSCGGTCVTLASDPQHCGACSTSCKGGFVCTASLCVCSTPASCGDPGLNPGCTSGRCSCGSAQCQPGERCVKAGPNSRCACNGAETCSAGTTCCAAGCVDLDTDAANCGACGYKCTPGTQCNAGTCGG